MQGLQTKQKMLRHDMTEPEKRVWSALRGNRVMGLKFRRQVPIGPYVVDFFCLALGLVIEIDGDDHATKQAYDQRRTDFLEQQSYHVMRFGNHDVMKNMDGVVSSIVAWAHAHGSSSPHPPDAVASGPSLSRWERDYPTGENHHE
jgi:very-short-patch-repair endonuclease